MKKLLLFSSIALFTFACNRDEIDFDKFDELQFSPGIQTPLVKASLTLEDLLVEDTLLTRDPDGGLRIIFNQDSIFSLSVIDFVNIPEQTPTALPVIVDTSASAVPLDIDLALGTLAGAELSSATFDEGYLKYEINTPQAINSPVDIRLTIKNASIGGQTFDNVLTLPSGATSIVDSVSVAGLIFDLSNGGTAVNFLGLRLEVESADSAQHGQLFNLLVNFTNLSIENATGFFGYRVVNIPNDQFDFDIPSLDNFTNGFFLTNPIINLNIDNGLGIELDLDLDLLGVNQEGSISDLDLQTQSITSPTTPGTIASSTILIDKNNSQIVDFLAALPNLINYGGVATLNPSAQGGGTVTNFIDKSSTISAGLVIDLPLEFRAENMTLEEIIDLSLFDDTTTTDQIEKLALYFRVDNGFPFDVDVSISFIDTLTGDSLQGVNLNLLSAAPVDAQGRVTQNTTSNESIVFDKSQIIGLIRSNQLKLNATLNTSNSGQDPVKLFTDYDLEIRLAAETELNLSLSNDD